MICASYFGYFGYFMSTKSYYNVLCISPKITTVPVYHYQYNIIFTFHKNLLLIHTTLYCV